VWFEIVFLEISSAAEGSLPLTTFDASRMVASRLSWREESINYNNGAKVFFAGSGDGRAAVKISAARCRKTSLPSLA
jgi:hypothetical protein